MRALLVASITMLVGFSAFGDDFSVVKALANRNGYKPNDRIIQAVVDAAHTYSIKVTELTAIGIVETGLGRYSKTRKNVNGTLDVGLFQINTVNQGKCLEYNLTSPEGSALCAAKLLNSIKKNYKKSYLGVYHSKTKAKKHVYLDKVRTVLAKVDVNE